MKKKLFLTVLSLSIILGIVISNQLPYIYNQKVLAEENCHNIIIIGEGEIETMPNIATMSFGIQELSSNIANGQDSILTKFNKIKTEIQKIDKNSDIFINYSNCYPTSENGITQYCFDYNITVETKMLDKINEIIKTAGENGINSFYNVNYNLSNKEEIYNNALVKAKDNAIAKVKALYDNFELKELYEINIYSCINNKKDNKISIKAKVKAQFCINNETIKKEDINNNTNNDKTIQTLEEKNKDLIEDIKDEKKDNQNGLSFYIV